MKSQFQQITTWVAIGVCCLPSVPAAAQQPSGDPKLNIVIVDGQGAINNIRQRASRDLTVQVEDGSQQPVAGAAVTFTLPSQGASGVFFNGEKTLVANTDNQGRAVARGLKPNNVAGKMEIRVTASLQGRTASGTITQFNMAVQNVASGGGGGKGKWIALLVVAGAAGAGGAVFATRRSSSSGTPTQPTAPAVITITPGAGTVGPPQ